MTNIAVAAPIGEPTQYAAMTDPQIAAFNAQQQSDAAALSSAQTILDAQAELDKSDITFHRCLEAGTTWPQAWIAYRSSLRDIVSRRSAGPLPARPDYPT